MSDNPSPASDLVVRPTAARDVDELMRWRADPRMTRWMLRTRTTADEMRARLADPGTTTSVVGVLDGRVVATGSVDVGDGMTQDEERAPRATGGLIGYLVAPEFHGRGVGTEMARRLLSIAFDDLGVRRVTAGCFADNTASWRVLERVGMRREQHGVEDSWHAELGWVDGYTYAMLRSEWEAQRRG
ncbi:GNAT family N-acetyltransferase [Phycicoccus sp. BSK3Z-2]|uniref:GNAT family N-acetyltransferase n=1 Tax=Phycicoccus avicenniae TaxID=2828860 RepID=A0A941HYX6_9MICO|nr:GNAT family protein [Phycicoccus avicenniae]MBR7742325.1 GNAT family N-acetyltransferase [Phycicoccus avicenniae]